MEILKTISYAGTMEVLAALGKGAAGLVGEMGRRSGGGDEPRGGRDLNGAAVQAGIERCARS